MAFLFLFNAMGQVWKYGCVAGLLLFIACCDTSTESYRNYDDDTTTTTRKTVLEDWIPHYQVAPRVTSHKSGYFKIVCGLYEYSWFPELYSPSLMDVVLLCTHVIYGYSSLEDNALLKLSLNLTDEVKGPFRSAIKLFKERGIKVIVASLCYDDDVSRVIQNPEKWSSFNEHAVAYLNKENFDGWELHMLTKDNSTLIYNASFVSWVKQLHAAFQPHALSLSVSDLSHSEVISIVAEHVDWVTVTPDVPLLWRWRHIINHTFLASTFYYSQHNGDFRAHYMNESVQYWISKGVPRRKLVMKLPSSGVGFTLASTNNTGLKAEANLQYEHESYSLICRNIQNGWNVVRDREGAMSSYIYKDDKWVSFNDIVDIQRKSEYIRMMDLGGAAAEMLPDDPNDWCGGGRYPILSTIRQVLGPAMNHTVSIPNNFMKDIGSYLILIICLGAIFGYSIYQVNRRYRRRGQNDMIMMEKKLIHVINRLVQSDGNMEPIEMPFVTLERKVELRRPREESHGPAPEYQLPLDPHWEISRDNIVLGNLLGEGEFGRVVLAKLTDDSQRGSTSVAVKMLKEVHSDSDMIDFVSEMEIMKIIGEHINIINLVGCCTQGGPLFVVVEFAPHGNLRDFLRGCRTTTLLTPQHEDRHVLNERDQVSISYQISRGMEYLVSKKLVHRDLAARNILVYHEFTVKVADFGLTREVNSSYYYRRTTEGKMPIRWMAPEALFDQVSTFQSDVWSYGVVLWEIFALGGNPYPSVSNQELYDMLKIGHRMEKPAGCSDEMYQIMRDCWMYRPKERPTFGELVLRLDSLLAQASPAEYLELDVPPLNIAADVNGDIEANVRI